MKAFGYVFLYPTTASVGNTAEDIHHGLLYCRRTHQKLILLRPALGKYSYFKTANKELYRLYSLYIATGIPIQVLSFLASLLCEIYFYLRALNLYACHNGRKALLFLKNLFLYFLKGDFKKPRPRLNRRGFYELLRTPWFSHRLLWHMGSDNRFLMSRVEATDWRTEYSKKISLRLNDKNSKNAQKKLLSLGVNLKKIVCLHVRDGGYYNDHLNPRNADVKTYLKSIRYLTEQGYFVFRMGDSKMIPIGESIPGFFDYPFSNLKSEFMDLFLIKNCCLYVGQPSGILDVSYLFSKKRMLISNAIEWPVTFPRHQFSRILFKQFISPNAKSSLRLKDLIDPELSLDLIPFGNPNYRYIDNSEDELVEATREILSLDKGTTVTPLQKESMERWRALFLRYLDHYPLRTPARVRFVYRYAAKMAGCSGFISKDSLERYW